MAFAAPVELRFDLHGEPIGNTIVSEQPREGLVIPFDGQRYRVLFVLLGDEGQDQQPLRLIVDLSPPLASGARLMSPTA